MSDTPFAPFVPPGSSNPALDAPFTETPKEKKAREKREAKEAKAAAKAAEPPHSTQLSQPRQKRKKANGDKPGLKFNLQTILAAASELNADDYPLFEKLINLLDEAGKPGRERLLAAIQKVFA